MKVVLDTNVLISAMVFGGKPRTVLELITIEKVLKGVTSEILIKELLGVLKMKFNYTNERLKMIEKIIRDNFIIVKINKIPQIIKSDPADNYVLATAQISNANIIISGDDHLLNIKNYRTTAILSPTKFIENIMNR